MPETAPTSTDSMIARLVVEQGLATPREVQECQSLQRRLSTEPAASRSLAEVLVSQGVVTRKQLQRVRGQATGGGSGTGSGGSAAGASGAGEPLSGSGAPVPLEESQQPAGQQIPGFQILGKLGAGAMAAVYKARQLSLDRLVAIKVLPRKQTNNPQFVERFYAEGRAAAKLNHSNIVGALDVGKAGEYHYFVMEYVEGKTVFDDIARLKRYPEAEALRVIIQIARALEHAHKAGFIHRDVKPKNIMITPAGVAKLADMGLARAVSDREAAEAEAGKAFGTPYYISPEQIRGDKDVDFRADIYGLGATLYHMVTGQVPFDGPNPSAVMHKHLKSPLVPPDHLNPALSAGISEIIEVCLAKSRSDRYRNTTDLLTDLEAVARGEPPLQARKRFDVKSLQSLEADADSPAVNQPAVPYRPVWKQPLFWAAVTGWAAAVGLGLSRLFV